MDRLEEKRKIKAKAYHERRVSWNCDTLRVAGLTVIVVGYCHQIARKGNGRAEWFVREAHRSGVLSILSCVVSYYAFCICPSLSFFILLASW